MKIENQKKFNDISNTPGIFKRSIQTAVRGTTSGLWRLAYIAACLSGAAPNKDWDKE